MILECSYVKHIDQFPPHFHSVCYYDLTACQSQIMVCVSVHIHRHRASFLKLWSADHKWSSGSALVVLLDWTLVQKRQKK